MNLPSIYMNRVIQEDVINSYQDIQQKGQTGEICGPNNSNITLINKNKSLNLLESAAISYISFNFMILYLILEYVNYFDFHIITAK